MFDPSKLTATIDWSSVNEPLAIFNWRVDAIDLVGAEVTITFIDAGGVERKVTTTKDKLMTSKLPVRDYVLNMARSIGCLIPERNGTENPNLESMTPTLGLLSKIQEEMKALKTEKAELLEKLRNQEAYYEALLLAKVDGADRKLHDYLLEEVKNAGAQFGIGQNPGKAAELIALEAERVNGLVEGIDFNDDHWFVLFRTPNDLLWGRLDYETLTWRTRQNELASAAYLKGAPEVPTVAPTDAPFEKLPCSLHWFLTLDRTVGFHTGLPIDSKLSVQLNGLSFPDDAEYKLAFVPGSGLPFLTINLPLENYSLRTSTVTVDDKERVSSET